MIYACPHCKRELEIPDKYAGQRGGCKYCGGAFEVPRPKPKPRQRPATENQIAYLQALGATDEELEGIGFVDASALIERYKEKGKATCRECGALIDDDSAFCKYCGAPTDETKHILIVNCGSEESKQSLRRFLDGSMEEEIDELREEVADLLADDD